MAVHGSVHRQLVVPPQEGRRLSIGFDDIDVPDRVDNRVELQAVGLWSRAIVDLLLREVRVVVAVDTGEVDDYPVRETGSSGFGVQVRRDRPRWWGRVVALRRSPGS